jgi:hypothetical protein
MKPEEFRSWVRAFLIELRDRAPKNIDDVVMAVNPRTQHAKTVLTADRRRPGESCALDFRNGAKLRFLFTFILERKQWRLNYYSFHFDRKERGGFFRYDLDPEAQRGLVHPLNHIHVGADEPRFPVGAVRPEDLFSFLVEQDLFV